MLCIIAQHTRSMTLHVLTLLVSACTNTIVICIYTIPRGTLTTAFLHLHISSFKKEEAKEEGSCQ